LPLPKVQKPGRTKALSTLFPIGTIEARRNLDRGRRKGLRGETPPCRYSPR
jgi:hypothetical protein